MTTRSEPPLLLAALLAAAQCALAAPPPPRSAPEMRARLHELQAQITDVGREEEAATIRVNALTRRHEADDAWAEGPEREQERAAAEALRARMLALDREYSRLKSVYEVNRTMAMTNSVLAGDEYRAAKQDLADVGALESFRRAIRQSQSDLTRALEGEQASMSEAKKRRARRRSRLARGAAALALAAAAAATLRFWRDS